MECFWCMMGYKENAEVLEEFCSAEINTELSQKMNSNLAGCLDCVMAYHYAEEHFSRNESCEKVTKFAWNLLLHSRIDLWQNWQIVQLILNHC